MALRAGPALRVLEGMAWAVSSSSRRFFAVVALVVGTSLLTASLATALVAARNAAAVEAAQQRGVEVAGSIADFRYHLGLTDNEVAAVRVSGDPDAELDRSPAYDDLRQASLALTEARVAATGQTAEDVEALAEQLDHYASMVDLSRIFPTTYLGLARKLVRVELVPRAECLRHAAQEEVAGATDRAAGLPTTAALAGSVLALVILLGSIALVAGRTRRHLHPTFVLAVVLGVAGLEATVGLVVVDGLWTQRAELQAASRTELGHYADSSAAAFALFDLRAYEMDAVASPDDGKSFLYEELLCGRGSGTSRIDDQLLSQEDSKSSYYEEFRAKARMLTDRLDADDDEVFRALPSAVGTYVESVEEVERLDREGDREAAASATLDDGSAESYPIARQRAASLVRSTSGLTARLRAADDADVSPMVPLLFGGASALLATTGVLLRGRPYW